MQASVIQELVEMATQRFGKPTVERAASVAAIELDQAARHPQRYPPGTLRQLVTHISRETSVPVSEILRDLGRHFFTSLLLCYPDLIASHESCVDLLEHLDCQVHAEVRRRQPEARLPRLTVAIDRECNRLTMLYRSPEALADVAFGLIMGCASYYEERVSINCEDLSEGNGAIVRFSLERWMPPCSSLFGSVVARQGRGQTGRY
jgi:hypothetical protein